MNWMRCQVPSIERAIALASDVLPTPGTSSMRRWPSASRHTSARRIASRLPWMTRSTLPRRASNRAAERGRGGAGRRGLHPMLLLRRAAVQQPKAWDTWPVPTGALRSPGMRRALLGAGGGRRGAPARGCGRPRLAQARPARPARVVAAPAVPARPGPRLPPVPPRDPVRERGRARARTTSCATSSGAATCPAGTGSRAGKLAAGRAATGEEDSDAWGERCCSTPASSRSASCRSGGRSSSC